MDEVDEEEGEEGEEGAAEGGEAPASKDKSSEDKPADKAKEGNEA